MGIWGTLHFILRSLKRTGRTAIDKEIRYFTQFLQKVAMKALALEILNMIQDRAPDSLQILGKMDIFSLSALFLVHYIFQTILESFNISLFII